MTRVMLVGAGRWGRRIAEKLAAMGTVSLTIVDDDVSIAKDVAQRLGCGYQRGVHVEDTHDSVIIATPPHTRERVFQHLMDRIELPSRIRFEKPTADAYRSAWEILQECQANGITASTGLTLFHSALYQNVMRYITVELDTTVAHITARRVGAAPAHTADPIMDLGPHAACFAAYYNVPLQLHAEYATDGHERNADWHLQSGEVVRINELDHWAQLPSGELYASWHDALHLDLKAFLADTHIGDAKLSLRMMRILETAKEVAA